MEIQQNNEVSNDQGIGIDGLAGAGVVDRNFILDDEDITSVSAISDDNLTISSSVAEDGASLSADVKSVAKILQTVLQEEEDKSYILNDEIMQLLESGATQIDEAVNKYFQAMVGQGVEVNELIDEFNINLSKLINEQVDILKDQDDLVSMLSRIIVELEKTMSLDDEEWLVLKDQVKDTETEILISNSNIEQPISEETAEEVFTGERVLFTVEESAVVDASVLLAESTINEAESATINSQSVSVEEQLAELIKKAEELAGINPNIEIVDASVLDESPKVSVEPQEVDVSALINPTDSSVIALVDKLIEEGVITDDMNEEDVVVAISNYLIREYTVSFEEDELGGAVLQPVAMTITSGGGSSEDLSVLLVSLCLAVGVDEDNIKVLSIKEGTSNEQLVAGYVTAEATTVELDLSQGITLIDIYDTKQIDEKTIISSFSFSGTQEQPTISAYDGTTVVDVRSFIDSDSPEVQQIIELMRTEGILTSDMSEDEQVLAIYHYVVQNYEYISDEETGLAWQTAESTIETGGGDCEDLTILFVDLCLAAGVKEESLRVFVEQGDNNTAGHVVAGYTMSSGEKISLDLTVGTSTQGLASLAMLDVNNYTFSFNSNSIEAYTSIGDVLVFEDPHYENSMYTAVAASTSQVSSSTTASMNTIIATFASSYATYIGHVNNLINYQQFFYEIPVDLSGVTEETAAFAAGNWVPFIGVDFEGMVDEFIGIKIQIYIMMACVILFNELLDVKNMMIQFLFGYKYENVKVLSAQRISDKYSSEISNLDGLITNALEDAMEKNSEAYELNIAEVERIAKECAQKVDSKKRASYENVLITHGNLLLAEQNNKVNTLLIESCRAAMQKLSGMSNSWETANIWQAVLGGANVDNNLQVSARFDDMVMVEQTGFVLMETTMDISSMILKILFGINSWNDDRAGIAQIASAVRGAEKQWISRYSNFLKQEVTNLENIKLARKSYEDAVKVWDKVKKGPGFFGSWFFMIIAVIILVVAIVAAIFTCGATAALAAGLWTAASITLACALAAAAVAAVMLGIYAYSQLAYQKEILEQMEQNLENDISLNYNLLKLDWVDSEYEQGGNEVGEILTTTDMSLNFGNQMNNMVSQAWGLLSGMSATGQINDINAKIMAFQIMLLSMLAIVDSMADARSAVMQVLFNVQTKVDMMQALQTWVTGTFASISSAFDYNSTMLYARASEHNRKLQVEMQLKSIRQQISAIEGQMARVIINTIVTVASMAALCLGWYGVAIAIVGALWSIYAAMQSMAEAKDAYDLAKKLYEEYKDKFSVGPSFNIPDWLYSGIETEDGNMSVLFQGLNSAMTGALNGNENTSTAFLAQMFAVLAISSAMMDARAIVITIMFGVNTGSQSKFVMAGFQAFGSYVMTMRGLEAQREQLQMQVDKILTDALLAIQAAKDNMNTANMYGWISIGIAIISILASALKLIGELSKFVQTTKDMLTLIANIITAITVIANAAVSMMKGAEEIDNKETAIARMKEAYGRMFSLNFDEFQSSGTNSALTSSAFGIVNNAASGMIVSSSGGRVTYDPSAAIAAQRAIKNWERTWFAQIAIAQAAADAKQAVMSMLFRTPSTVENFQKTSAIVGYQASAMQIALQLAVALAKIQVSAFNSIVSAQESLAAAKAANTISMCFSILQIVGGVMQLADSKQVPVKDSNNNPTYKLDDAGKPKLDSAGNKIPITEGWFTSKLDLQNSPWAKAGLTLVTGYGGEGTGFKNVAITTFMNLLRNLIKELLTYYAEKKAREEFRANAEAKADKAFGTGNSGNALSMKTTSNARAREDSAFELEMSQRRAALIDSISSLVAFAFIDVVVGGMKTAFKSSTVETTAKAEHGSAKPADKKDGKGKEGSAETEGTEGTVSSPIVAPGQVAIPNQTPQPVRTEADATKSQAMEGNKAKVSTENAAKIREEALKKEATSEVNPNINSVAAATNKTSAKYDTSFSWKFSPSVDADDRIAMKDMTDVQKNAYMDSKRDHMAVKQFSLDLTVKLLKNLISEMISQRAKVAQIIASSQSGSSSGASFGSAIAGISSNATTSLQKAVEESLDLFKASMELPPVKEAIQNSTLASAIASRAESITPASVNKSSSKAVTPSESGKTSPPVDVPASVGKELNSNANKIFVQGKQITVIKDSKVSLKAQTIINDAKLTKDSTIQEIKKVLEELKKLEEFKYEIDKNDCDKVIALMAAIAQAIELPNYQLVITKDAKASAAHISAEFTINNTIQQMDFSAAALQTTEIGALSTANNNSESAVLATLQMSRQVDATKAKSGFEVTEGSINFDHQDTPTMLANDNKLSFDNPDSKMNDMQLQGEKKAQDATVQAGAAAQGATVALVSNNQTQQINSVPVVAQAKQTMAGEGPKVTEPSTMLAIASIQQIIDSFHDPFVDKSKRDSAQIDKEEKESVKEIVKALEQIKQQVPISIELITQVSKGDLKSKDSMNKLLEVVEVLKELSKAEKDPKIKVQLQEALTELKTTLETISLTKSKDGALAKIFNSTAPAEEKTALLNSLNNPTAVVRYVKENPVVMKEPLFGENNRKALMDYVLQEDKVKPKDVDEFNVLVKDALKDMGSVISKEQMVKELSSVIVMSKEKSEQMLVRGIVLLEEMVREDIVKAEDVKKQVSQLVQALKENPKPRKEQEVLNVMLAILADPSIIDNINKSKEVLAQTSVIKMIAQQMPEIKLKLEKLKVQDVKTKQQDDTTLNDAAPAVVSETTPVQGRVQPMQPNEVLSQTSGVNVAEKVPEIRQKLEQVKAQESQDNKQEDPSIQSAAAVAISSNAQIPASNNINIDNKGIDTEVAKAKQTDAGLLSEIERKMQTTTLQSLENIQKVIEAFYSPFIDNSKKNVEQVAKDETLAVSKVVQSLEQIKQQLPISPQLNKLITEVGKGDLKSKDSINKLLEVVEVLKELSKAEKNPKIKVQLQESLVALKTMLETISLTKSKDGQLSTIFSGDFSANDKTDKLVALDNPIAVVRYVTENSVVLNDKIVSRENSKALIRYLLQEDRVKIKDEAEFQILAMDILEDIAKKMDHTQIVEELLLAVAQVPADKADQSLIKAMVLFEELVTRGIIKEESFKNKMPEVFELVKYSPIPRSDREINKIINVALASPVIDLNSTKNKENILDKTKVIKLIAELFNINQIPAVDVLGIANASQQLQQNVENIVSDNFIPEKGQGGFNPEDIIAKNVSGVSKLLDNIYEAIDKDWKDSLRYTTKNVEQIAKLGVIAMSEEFRASFSKLMLSKTLNLEDLQEVIDNLAKDVNLSKLTIPQKEGLALKMSSLKTLVSAIQQTRGKEQKIAEALSSQNTPEEKIKELILFKSPENILNYVLKSPQILDSNRSVVLGYIAQETAIPDIEQFVDLSEQIIVSMKLSDKEKSSFVKSICDGIKMMSSLDSETVVSKSLSLLDVLISSGQLDQDVAKEIIPLMILSARKESQQKQIKIVSNVITRLDKPGQEGAMSQVFLQNFSDLRKIITNSSRASASGPESPSIRPLGTDLLISNLPIEVLSKDFRNEAVKSVLRQIEKSPSFVENEKVSNYLQEYITTYLKLSSWGQDTFQLFSANVNSLLVLSNKGEVMVKELIEGFINSNNDPQEKFVATLKILALYEAKLAQNTNEAKLVLSKLRESYDSAIEYLIISLPTLGEAIGQAVGYLSKQTRDRLRERVESSLSKGTTILKRGNELILSGLNEADGLRK